MNLNRFFSHGDLMILMSIDSSLDMARLGDATRINDRVRSQSDGILCCVCNNVIAGWLYTGFARFASIGAEWSSLGFDTHSKHPRASSRRHGTGSVCCKLFKPNCKCIGVPKYDKSSSSLVPLPAGANITCSASIDGFSVASTSFNNTTFMGNLFNWFFDNGTKYPYFER